MRQANTFLTVSFTLDYLWYKTYIPPKHMFNNSTIKAALWYSPCVIWDTGPETEFFLWFPNTDLSCSIKHTQSSLGTFCVNTLVTSFRFYYLFTFRAETEEMKLYYSCGIEGTYIWSIPLARLSKYGILQSVVFCSAQSNLKSEWYLNDADSLQ